MGFWLNNMPKGMHLKSEGFASSLFDADGKFPLKAYCLERNLPYEDMGLPVPLEQFSAYGLEFQRRYVPEVVQQKASRLENSPEGFKITLENGEAYAARRVVIAIGLSYYEYIPPELADLPSKLMTHSARHSVLDAFRGREVAVVGAGSSAIDLAALLHEAGASVHVIARTAKVNYHEPPDAHKSTILQRAVSPATGIGFGWKIWMCANLPLLFRLMPERFRLEKVKSILGPAPGWFIRERVEGKVHFHLGTTLEKAEHENGRVHLELLESSGAKKTVEADHVIAATGYSYDVARIAFLNSDIVARLVRTGDAPKLSANFESSVKGLYFVGVTAANTFGPLLRFAVGAGFAAPHIAKHLTRTAAQKAVVRVSTASGSQGVTERESA